MYVTAADRFVAEGLFNAESSLFIPAFIERIKEIAWKALQVVALFFASLLSFGIVPLIGSYFQRRRIEKLEGDGYSGEVDGVFYRWTRPLYLVGGDEPREIASSSAAEPKAQEVMCGVEEMEELLTRAKPWAAAAMAKIIDGEGDLGARFQSRFVVYLLVRYAGLSYGCDQSRPFVAFNELLKVGFSEACRLRKKGEEGCRVRYLQSDEWAPLDPVQFPDGIDPVSLKWILYQLEKEAGGIEFFEKLLLKEWGGEELLSSLHEWEAEGGRSFELAKRGLYLVDAIASSLRGRYPTIFPSAGEKEAYSALERPTPFDAAKGMGCEEGFFSEDVKEALFFVGKYISGVLTFGMLPFGLFIYQQVKIERLKSLHEEKAAARKYEIGEDDEGETAIESVTLQKMLTSGGEKGPLEELATLEPLVDSAFRPAFRQLVNFSDKGKYGVVFSKSEKINEQYQLQGYWFDTYASNKLALYNWIAYKLIPLGSVRFDREKNAHHLYFSEKLAVAYSQPLQLPKAGGEGSVQLFYQNDDWSVEGKSELCGVDPVAIYWTVNKVKKSPAAKEALECLLLSSLIPDDETALKRAKAFAAEESEEAKLVRTSYELISDLGRSFSEIYKNSFFTLWSSFASDMEAKAPLLKAGGAVLLEELKGPCEWVFRVDESSPYIEEYHAVTKSIVTAVWSHLHKHRVEREVTSVEEVPKDEALALKLLKKQYRSIHINLPDAVDPHKSGCLFSALCTFLCQGAGEAEKFNAQNLRESLGDYLTTLLNNRENGQSEADRELLDYFRREIEQSTKGGEAREGWTVEEFALWLHTNASPEGKRVRGHYDAGEIEIELFCCVYGIGVHVFRGGERYRLEEGMMLPIRRYGPNTVEKVILFNSTGLVSEGFTFFLLSPKLRSEIEADTQELAAAIEHDRSFWQVNSTKGWNDTISPWNGGVDGTDA